MIKTVLTTTCAFALMSGMALAQTTSGGTARGPSSPTSKNSGVTLSTGQTQPLTGYSSTSPGTGVDNTAGSATGGPGANPNGGPPATPMPGSTSASMPQSTMPSTSMPSSSMVANTPAGDAPATYPKCTHKGQDRCMSRARG